MKTSVDQAIRKAAKLASRGQLSDAEAIYREILHYFPANQRAVAGLRALSAPLIENPPQHEMQSLIGRYNQGRLREAVDQASALLRRYPNSLVLHDIAGAAHAGLGDFAQAAASFEKALQLNPHYADAYNNRGIALQRLRRLEEALASFEKAVQIRPDFAVAYYNRGIALQDLKRTNEALISYDRALQLKPDYTEAYDNRGTVLQDLKRPDEALASFDKALELRPDYAVAHYNRGNVLRDLKRWTEALLSYDRVLQLEPDHAEAMNNRGSVLYELRRLDVAIGAFDNALRLKPDYAEAHHNRANVLHDQKRLEEAIVSYDRALQLRPDYADAYNNRGIALQDLNRLAEAAASYDKALQLKPDYAEAFYNRSTAAARMCDWRALAHTISVSGLDGEIPPFAMLAAADDPERQLERAKAWTRAKYPAAPKPDFKPAARGEKLKLGYFSADFHEHAVMFLIARMLELHDKDRFEVHAFSYGTNRDDAMRRRIVAAVDQFHDVSDLDAAAVAELARKKSIDIAVDLNGHTNDAKLEIFAGRLAPLQVSYLGYPGSTGADFIDYVIADKIVLPPSSRAFFTEEAITLPHSYQANDNQRIISDRRFERAELGLPAGGFVFCCFNNSYKISPAEFDVWMRLLGRAPGSVLWLLKDNKWAEANLRKEADARGVDPSRLVFAERMPLADHLARHRCADLFLDTFNYNAHTTASDALWAGLPVVTKLGKSFAARVAGSLLNAVDMPELATSTVEVYERLALELAANPDRLAAVRAKLAANRLTTPLFDSERFTRHIERAYEIAYDRFFDGLPPDHIAVD